jgi:hypothetical protein
MGSRFSESNFDLRATATISLLAVASESKFDSEDFALESDSELITSDDDSFSPGEYKVSRSGTSADKDAERVGIFIEVLIGKTEDSMFEEAVEFIVPDARLLFSIESIAGVETTDA